MFRVLIVVALFAFIAPAIAEDSDLSLRVYDVSTLTAPRLHQFGRPLGAMLPNSEISELPEAEPVPFLQIDALADLIRETVEPESWDQEGADIQGREGGMLLVKHRVHVLTKVETLLSSLSHAASRRVRFEVSVQPGATEEKKRLEESGSVEAYPGVSTTFKVTNRVRFLSTYNTRIAEAAALAEPVVIVADEGFSIDLIAHPSLEGDRIVVEAHSRQGRFARPVRRLSLSDNPDYLLGSVDLPVFRQAESHSTHMVRSGGAFTLRYLSNGKPLSVRVKATLLGRGGPPGLLDVGALSRPQARFLAGYYPENTDYQWLTTTAPGLFRLEEGFQPMAHVEDLMDLVSQNVDPWYWEQEGTINVTESGAMFVKAKTEVLDRLRRFLLAREKAGLKPIGLSLELRSVESAVVSGAAKEVPAGTTYASTALATLAGKECCAMLGSTRNYVAGYDAEIAQSAKISRPEIGQAFEGIVANLRPLLSMDGATVRLELGLLVAHASAVDEPRDPEAEFVGKIELPSTKRSVFQTTVEFPRDSVYVLDVGPDPSDPKRRLAAILKAK